MVLSSCGTVCRRFIGSEGELIRIVALLEDTRGRASRLSLGHSDQERANPPAQGETAVHSSCSILGGETSQVSLPNGSITVTPVPQGGNPT